MGLPRKTYKKLEKPRKTQKNLESWKLGVLGLPRKTYKNLEKARKTYRPVYWSKNPYIGRKWRKWLISTTPSKASELE